MLIFYLPPRVKASQEKKSKMVPKLELCVKIVCCSQKFPEGKNSRFKVELSLVKSRKDKAHWHDRGYLSLFASQNGKGEE